MSMHTFYTLISVNCGSCCGMQIFLWAVIKQPSALMCASQAPLLCRQCNDVDASKHCDRFPADLSRSQPEPHLSSGSTTGLLGSTPDVPGMPATRKVSFASLGGHTPAGSRPGSVPSSPHSNSVRGSKSYWDHMQEGNTNPKPPPGSSPLPDASGKPRDSSDLGVQETRELMRRLNFSK